MFALRQKHKDEGNNLMQKLVKLTMNSFYGVQLRKHIINSYNCKSKTWMKTEYDEKCIRLFEITKWNYIVKLKKDDDLESCNGIKNTLPSRLGAFFLSKCERNKNNFFRELNEFYNKSIYYGDTDSLYIGKKLEWVG